MDTTNARRAATWMLLAAVVFATCSGIRGLGGSSMLSLSYPEQANSVMSIAMGVAYVPGWFLTGLLLLIAASCLWPTSYEVVEAE